MSVAQSEITGEVEIFRNNARSVHRVVHRNVGGFTHEESLIQPTPAGNCLNWVVGHLVCIYNNILPLLRQEQVMEPAALQAYDRGSAPIKNGSVSLKLQELLAAWDEEAKRIDAGLLSLTAKDLDAPVPFSPSNNPNETVRSLLATIWFHQAYHAGQTGILRRIAGKEGAIR